ncbi:MAG: protein phosphatase CheZ [Stappiaceae bacterium]
MSALRKPFRVEFAGSGTEAGENTGGQFADMRHDQIISEIAALKELIAPTQDLSTQVLDDYKKEFAEAVKLKTELDAIYEAINRTKFEIATLHHSGFEGEEMCRVTNELDAIVDGTENATELILTSAEFIDEASGKLADSLTGDDETLAQEIQDKVIKIFEACNFQDLTGQRISKVVQTLSFIEERIVRVMEIWGGIDSFSDIEVADVPNKKEGDEALLNGPALEIDSGVASQDDIDALFP